MTGASPIPGLAVDVQRRLEALYALEPAAPVSDFLIEEKAAAALPGGGSRTLVSQDGEDLSVGVVVDEEVVGCLSARDPLHRLDEANLGHFCTLTEEVSHFVYLMSRARHARSLTQLEMELQGEVDKYLTAVFLLSLQNEGAVSPRLKDLLFQHYRLRETLSEERKERYRAASDFAFRYCGFLENRFLRKARVRELAREARRFYRMGQREKLETIAVLQ